MRVLAMITLIGILTGCVVEAQEPDIYAECREIEDFLSRFFCEANAEATATAEAHPSIPISTKSTSAIWT